MFSFCIRTFTRRRRRTTTTTRETLCERDDATRVFSRKKTIFLCPKQKEKNKKHFSFSSFLSLLFTSFSFFFLLFSFAFFSLFPSFLLLSQKKELDLGTNRRQTAAPSTKNPTRRRGRDEEEEDDDDGKEKEKQDQKRRRTRPKKRCFSRQSHRAGGNFLEIRVFLRCFRKVVRGVVENECLERL